jgi:hypothetical protein
MELVAKHDFTVVLWVRLPVFILDLFLVVTAYNNPDMTSVSMARKPGLQTLPTVPYIGVGCETRFYGGALGSTPGIYFGFVFGRDCL